MLVVVGLQTHCASILFHHPGLASYSSPLDHFAFHFFIPLFPQSVLTSDRYPPSYYKILLFYVTYTGNLLCVCKSWIKSFLINPCYSVPYLVFQYEAKLSGWKIFPSIKCEYSIMQVMKFEQLIPRVFFPELVNRIHCFCVQNKL